MGSCDTGAQRWRWVPLRSRLQHSDIVHHYLEKRPTLHCGTIVAKQYEDTCFLALYGTLTASDSSRGSVLEPIIFKGGDELLN